jgi:hypothetical protein
VSLASRGPILDLIEAGEYMQASDEYCREIGDEMFEIVPLEVANPEIVTVEELASRVAEARTELDDDDDDDVVEQIHIGTNFDLDTDGGGKL